jgi:hypothetical protein
MMFYLLLLDGRHGLFWSKKQAILQVLGSFLKGDLELIREVSPAFRYQQTLLQEFFACVPKLDWATSSGLNKLSLGCWNWS